MSEFNERLCALLNCSELATVCSTLVNRACVPVCGPHRSTEGQIKQATQFQTQRIDS